LTSAESPIHIQSVLEAVVDFFVDVLSSINPTGSRLAASRNRSVAIHHEGAVAIRVGITAFPDNLGIELAAQ
jgi:hypothetical protein